VENLRELYATAGVLLVDAQGHGIIAAKIASTIHEPCSVHAVGAGPQRTITPRLFEQLNLRLAQSATARNAWAGTWMQARARLPRCCMRDPFHRAISFCQFRPSAPTGVFDKVQEVHGG